ncbi:MAG TPA: cadmium-translocating P-type ATPase, partial [Candidatus Merdenecus merdavium]|nr:cadmium-translocating P-type ATPase [Candidatus Merdenecus merdavium]
MKQRRYILKNLDCANCAAKMERKISQMEHVSDVTITYATKQLRLSSDMEEEVLLPQLQTICSSIESAVKVIKPTAKRGNRVHEHEGHEEHHTHDAHEGHHHGSEAFEHLKARQPATKNFWKDEQELIQILIGVIFFGFGLIIKNTSIAVSLISYVIAYIILGGEVILSALKNITKGQIFDENFLMSIATIGAFIIGEYPEAVGVMLFFCVGELFEHKAVEKSRNQIIEAIDLRPEVVQLVDHQKVTTIPAEDAKIGDILLIRPGDRIPLDGVIVEGDTRIDTSPITGEPVPVKAIKGDPVTSGCVNSSGVIKIKVEKVLEDSMVSRILDSVENAAASKPKIDRFITTFSRYYTPIVVALALIVAFVPSIITGDWNHWVYTALTFLVISCPCALVLSVPLAYFSGIGSGSKKGILFKGGVSLEAMKNVKAVVMDKTGTITKGDFTVQEIIPAKDKSIETMMTLCASSELSSTHPIGSSIVSYAKSKGLNLTPPSSIEEISGHGIKATIEDQEVLVGNQKLMDLFHVNMEQKKHQQYGTEVYVAANGEYLGSVLIADTLKEEAVDAIGKIKAQGIHTVMLTGDSKESAQAIAEIAGIDEVHAKLLPEDKLNELRKIRDKKGAIMFVGDGINDAPVLAGADVGAAMGSGADAAIEAADVVFMTSSVEAIPQSLSIAKVTAS